MKQNQNLRAAAIHDLSGMGKCSLSVVLPILSAMGVETSVLPTAVLSTHTAFEGWEYRDFTEDMMPFARHWKREGAQFEALYSGFLGSFRQIELVSDIFTMFKEAGTLIMVDPVMGDMGKLYRTYTPEMAEGMTTLCRMADIIVPNMTEAFYLAKEPYREGPYTKEEIEALLKKLSALGPKFIVLTGVWFKEEEIGSACFFEGETEYCFFKKYPGFFHGTGDIYASVLLGGILNGFSVAQAQRLAIEFTGRTIAATVESGKNPLFGACFEKCLPYLFEKITEKA